MKVKHEQWEKLYRTITEYRNRCSPIYMEDHLVYSRYFEYDQLILDSVKKATEIAERDSGGVDPSDIQCASTSLLGLVIFQYVDMVNRLNENEYLEIIKQLLEMKPNPNIIFESDYWTIVWPGAKVAFNMRRMFKITPLALVMTLFNKEECIYIAEKLLDNGADVNLGEISPILTALLVDGNRVRENNWRIQFLRSKNLDIRKKYNYLVVDKNWKTNKITPVSLSPLQVYMYNLEILSNSHKIVEDLLGNYQIPSTEEINYIKELCQKDYSVSNKCLCHYVLLANARKCLEEVAQVFASGSHQRLGEDSPIGLVDSILIPEYYMKYYKRELISKYISRLQLLEEAKKELRVRRSISLMLQEKLKSDPIVCTLLHVETIISVILKKKERVIKLLAGDDEGAFSVDEGWIRWFLNIKKRISNDSEWVLSENTILTTNFDELLKTLFLQAEVEPVIPVYISAIHSISRRLEVGQILNEEETSRNSTISKFITCVLIYSTKNTNLQKCDIEQIGRAISTSLQKELNDLYKTKPLQVNEIIQCLNAEIHEFIYWRIKRQNGYKYKLARDSSIVKFAKNLKEKDLIHKNPKFGRNTAKMALKKVFGYSIQGDVSVKNPSIEQLSDLNKLVTGNIRMPDFPI